MENMTLVQIKEKYNISRRAIQGYEKEGLVFPTGKTKRGYLLYDEKAVLRLREIKQYQDMGFKVKEIVRIIDAPNQVVKEALTEKRARLLEKQEDISQLIELIDRRIADI